MPQPKEIRISYAEMESVFHKILLSYSFTPEKAAALARIFADNSLDGVYSHGVNRFSRFIRMVGDKHILAAAEPTHTATAGALEQWNGNLGPGPTNAFFCTNRAIELADKNAIGCVALANTNHWMRGGSYGWQAAKKGYAFICWTNTIANMPAWGATDSRLGNNPLILALPFNDDAIVLDMAVSQFSFGAMENLARQQKQLTVPGGYNQKGEMTADPVAILETQRSLPIGYWKGSGLALLLDLLAAVLSGGRSTFEITKEKIESGVSQVFIAIKLASLSNYSSINSLLNNVINNYHAAIPDGSNNKIAYPGERVLQTRSDNLEDGIPVNVDVWQTILALA